MVNLNFEDVLCEVMVAGEDESELTLVRGVDTEECTVNEVSSEELMDMLLEREDQFVSCEFSGTRLNMIMQNETFFIDIF